MQPSRSTYLLHHLLEVKLRPSPSRSPSRRTSACPAQSAEATHPAHRRERVERPRRSRRRWCSRRSSPRRITRPRIEQRSVAARPSRGREAPGRSSPVRETLEHARAHHPVRASLQSARAGASQAGRMDILLHLTHLFRVGQEVAEMLKSGAKGRSGKLAGRGGGRKWRMAGSR